MSKRSVSATGGDVKPGEGWSAALFYDGQQVTGPIPCDDYDAATIASPLMASWIGGPISVAQAVVASRTVVLFDEPSLFDEVA